MNVGPIQILVVGFARDDFTCKILPNLRVLDEKGFIKIIDVLFAKKDIKGNIFALNENELTAEESVRFGSVAGALIGLGISEVAGGGEAAGAGYFALAENDFGSNLKDLAGVIENIPKDSSFAVVLIEQRWTIELKDNITQAGGVLLAQGQVSPLSLINIGAEIAAATNYEKL
jgi:uncharacterized membrane protein